MPVDNFVGNPLKNRLQPIARAVLNRTPKLSAKNNFLKFKDLQFFKSNKSQIFLLLISAMQQINFVHNCSNITKIMW